MSKGHRDHKLPKVNTKCRQHQPINTKEAKIMLWFEKRTKDNDRMQQAIETISDSLIPYLDVNRVISKILFWPIW